MRIKVGWHLLVVCAALSLGLNSILVSAQSTPDAAVQAASASGSAQAGGQTVGAGRVVSAQFSATPPVLTAEQMKALEERLARSNRAGPAGPKAAVPVVPRGPEQGVPNSTALAPGTFTVFRNTIIPAGGVNGYGNISGRAHEPSTGANGKNVFQTGNWYATRSFNNGGTWGYLNPYTIFGSDLGGFCCDQVTIYDSSRDVQFWLLQFAQGLKLAISRGSSLFTSWCYYNITPSWYGQPAAEIDYNEMALGRRFVYITSNLFTALGGGAGMLRIPIDPLLTCSGFSYNSIAFVPGGPNGWSFTWVPTLGATGGVMYWASNWNQGQPLGSSFRVYSWAENTTTYFWWNRTVTAFAFMGRNSGQNCGSATGVVKNWCQFNDSRVKGGVLARGTLYFSFDVMQGSGYTFPYSRIVRFRESDKVYLGKSDIFASWGAFQYTDLGVNVRGDIGMVTAWGGGTGTTNYYPSSGVLIQDDYSPSQPWQRRDVVSGAGNPCTSDGLYRWGDYLSARAYDPAGQLWIASTFAIKGASCPNTGWYSEPHNVIFGRDRDRNSHDRWKIY